MPNTFRISFFFVLVLVLFAQNTSAQWQRLTTMEGAWPGADFFAIMDSALHAGYSNSYLRTTDNGDSWSKTSAPTAPTCIARFGQSYVAGANGVYYIKDSTSPWLRGTALPYGIRYVSGITTSEDQIFVVADGYSVVMSSKDTGRTWDSITIAPPSQLASMASNKRYIFAAGTLSPTFDSIFPAVFRSSDQGATWEDVSCREGQSGTTTLLVNDEEIIVATGDVIFRSSDDGVSWQRAYMQWDGTSLIRKIRPYHDGYIAITNKGLRWSKNGGRDWRTMDDALPEAYVNDVIVHAGHVFIGSETNIYRRPVGELAIEELELPKREKLWIANVSLVGDELTFSFHNFEESMIEVEIHDAVGRVMLSGTLSHTGNAASLDSESLPSGLYFARLTQGSQEAVCKFVITR